MVKLSAAERKVPCDRLVAVFDDQHAVANAGLILSATLAEKLGIKDAADEMIDLGDVPGGALPGRKVMTLIHSMCLGGDSIDDTDVLRAGETSRVLGHRVMAPSTIGTFLRAFTFGHVRQLDRVLETALTRAWQAGAGPGDEPLVIDIDSLLCARGWRRRPPGCRAQRSGTRTFLNDSSRRTYGGTSFRTRTLRRWPSSTAFCWQAATVTSAGSRASAGRTLCVNAPENRRGGPAAQSTHANVSYVRLMQGRLQQSTIPASELRASSRRRMSTESLVRMVTDPPYRSAPAAARATDASMTSLVPARPQSAPAARAPAPSDAERTDEDFRSRGGADYEIVVGGGRPNRLRGRNVVGIVREQRGNHHARVDDDQSRQPLRISSR